FIWEPTTDAYFAELDNSNTYQRIYTFEPVPYGNMISMRVGSNNFIHADALGSTRALSQGGTTVTDTFLYDAWGNEVARTGTTAIVPFRWVGGVGYYYDTDTGLYYVRARVYQPTVARWCSMDPWLDSLFGQQLYGGNMPVFTVDPTGLFHLKHSSVTGKGNKGTPECGNFWWEAAFQFSEADLTQAPFALIQKVRWNFEIYGCSECGIEPKLRLRTAKCPKAFTTDPGAPEVFEFYELWSVVPDRKGGIQIFGGQPPSGPIPTRKSGKRQTSIGPHDAFGETAAGPFTQTLRTPYEISGEFFVVPLSGTGSITDPYDIPGGWDKWVSDLFAAAKLTTAHAMCLNDASPELIQALRLTPTVAAGKNIVGVGRSLTQTWTCCELFNDPPAIDLKYSPSDEETNIDLPRLR
ncbi:MAG: RHS repeat-associated core domain-containing protein, partial [Planctomycetaceae bacterium]